MYRIPGILHLWYTKSAPLVQRLCSLEVPFALMVKHQCCTLACQVHLDCGTAPLPCMVQRAPSAVHLCCTYGTRRTIPIKLKYGTCARCGAPVVCSPLHCTPAAAEIHAETHWSERHLNLNERTMSCAKRYLRKRRKVILTLMPFTHRACFLCHT